jgi:hypothetical protein
MPAGNGAAADRFGGGDIILDDCLENLPAAG